MTQLSHYDLTHERGFTVAIGTKPEDMSSHLDFAYTLTAIKKAAQLSMQFKLVQAGSIFLTFAKF